MKPQRVPSPEQWPGSKTGRRYAIVSAAIRKLAATGRPFSRLDFPQFSPEQMRNRLHAMERNGELIIFKKAVHAYRGRGTPPIYRLNKNTYDHQTHPRPRP